MQKWTKNTFLKIPNFLKKKGTKIAKGTKKTGKKPPKM